MHAATSASLRLVLDLLLLHNLDDLVRHPQILDLRIVSFGGPVQRQFVLTVLPRT